MKVLVLVQCVKIGVGRLKIFKCLKWLAKWQFDWNNVAMSYHGQWQIAIFSTDKNWVHTTITCLRFLPDTSARYSAISSSSSVNSESSDEDVSLKSRSFEAIWHEILVLFTTCTLKPNFFFNFWQNKMSLGFFVVAAIKCHFFPLWADNSSQISRLKFTSLQ